MTKSLLTSLDLTTAPIKHHTDPIMQRREKLLERLSVQKEMIECLLADKVFTTYKDKWVTDPETGAKRKERVVKNIKPWFYQIQGQYFMDVKYGSKTLELSKGLHAIAVGEKERLYDVVCVVIDAVKAGELDKQLGLIKRVGQK